jgi:hypothetical protein
MEIISVGSVTGAMKIGLQVISNHKRPVLEIYYQLINELSEEFELPNTDTTQESIKYRHKETGVIFYLVNIGGCRAENVVLDLSGELDRQEKRRSIRNMGIFNNIIPSIPPSQTILLMKLDEFDLYDEHSDNGTPNAITNKTLSIKFSYDGENQGLNKFFLWWRKKLGKKKQYTSIFRFIPKLLDGADLPIAK